jgi:hypothetical protein
MSFTVEVVYRDGSVAVAGAEFAELRDASFQAIRLADDLGRTMTPYTRGIGEACSVVVLRDGLRELEIKIFPGGLNPKGAVAGEIDLTRRSDD